MPPKSSKLDPNCGSLEQVVFVGNVRLEEFFEPDLSMADPASSVLTIDVIASPGNDLRPFYFVTLILRLVSPDGARFVDHSGRNNFHWDVLADPATAERAFEPPIPGSSVVWAEDFDDVPSTSTLRIRDDITTLLSSPSNGRTYFVGIAGLTTTDALDFRALASASDYRMSSCDLTIADLHAGEALPGYIG